MARKLIGLVCLLWIGTIVVSGQEHSLDPRLLSTNGEVAHTSLIKARLFAIGGVGYGGQISDGEKALDVLIEEKDAINALKDLVSNASLEGALYGLFGLRMLKCECFNSEMAKYRYRVLNAPEGEVNIAAGCFYFRTKDGVERVRLIDGLLGEQFERQAERKECKRQTSGRRRDTQKCVSEVLNNK